MATTRVTPSVTALPAPSRDPFWNHSTHYHRLVPRVAPPPWTRVLDVGCGEGLLTRRLAPLTTDEVVGVDVSADAVRRAEAQADSPRLRYVCGDVLEVDVDGPYDLVTCVAMLHHVPLRAGLERLHELTAPGGTLVVVGLANPSAPADWAVVPASVVATRWAAWRRAGWDPAVDVADARVGLAEVRRAARDVMPGAVVRNRLFWRYSLVWTAPTGS